jgi:hypothetical protein
VKPIVHAKNSAAKWGGKADEYVSIHQFLDESKAHIADHRHRALMHNAFGCFLIEKVFGLEMTNSEGKIFSPRDVAEQHIIEDLGHIPTVQDWLSELPIKEWMGGGKAADIPSSNAIQQYKNARQALKALGTKLAKEYKEVLSQEFDKSPYEAISWTTYIPGFNDGDPCTFSVGSVYATKTKLTKKQQDHWREQTSPGDDWDADEYGEIEAEDVYGKGTICEFINKNEDLLEKAFGSDTHVTWIRGKGIKVEEYHCGY